jgi:hypothetical protein
MRKRTSNNFVTNIFLPLKAAPHALPKKNEQGKKIAVISATLRILQLNQILPDCTGVKVLPTETRVQ